MSYRFSLEFLHFSMKELINLAKVRHTKLTTS
nr:MAG TPA: hypothetical protein [Caudoviricetes sp.]